jgi:hypothetical protein
MTMGSSWAYNPEETQWKAPAELVRSLVEVVSRGGNFLLNVGPTPHGTFPPEALERLAYLGSWMALNQAAIYGNTYTPIQGFWLGRTTRKDRHVHLHVMDWPDDRRVVLEDFPGQVASVHLMNGEAQPFTQQGSRLEIDLAQPAPDADVSVLAVELASFDESWIRYTPAEATQLPPGAYLKQQARSCAIINAVINGLIAFFAYRERDRLPTSEAGVDILISVAIISFLTGWILVGAARSEVIKGNLVRGKAWGFPMPGGAGLRALLIMLACVAGFGGLILAGPLFLLAPGGVHPWVYIVFKIVYTAVSAALAAGLAILSVIHDGEWRNHETLRKPD